MKPIVFSGHSLDNLKLRGVQKEEIEKAIQASEWKPAKKGRHYCLMNFKYGTDWGGKTYGTKQVKPVFVEEEDRIVVVTVYSFYF
jgi:hypothetical protein